MAEPTASLSPMGNPLVELVEALSNRQGEVDIRLDRLAVRLPLVGQIEATGSLSLSVHLRPLSARELKAREGRQIRHLSA
jgi:hypothetical protein